MSSFKRRISAKQDAQPGAKASPTSHLTRLVSTGIPSLDDILGGGLPLSCSLLIGASDHHSSYGELVQKYFIAQGLKSGHNLFVIAHDAERFVKEVMWTPRNAESFPNITDDENKLEDGQEPQEIKIAWRYEQMKSFQTTVLSSPSSSMNDFCHTFDLGSSVPASFVEDAISSKQVSLCSIEQLPEGMTACQWVLDRIAAFLGSEQISTSPIQPLRICIPLLGSPWWGDLSDQHILHFLHSLRATLRRYSSSCAVITISPTISTDRWGGPGWMQKLGWVSDAALTMSAFSGDPSLTAIFPNHHGLVHIYAMPSPHTLLAPSDRLSTLRGLGAASSACGGTENNITFKCTRKRLVFETLHLDVEGGVSERRTTASSAASLDIAAGSLSKDMAQVSDSALPGVQVEVEELVIDEVALGESRRSEDKEEKMTSAKRKKPKKQVAFWTGRPDLCDF